MINKTCMVCGEDAHFWCQPDSGFLKCAACGLIYREPMPSEMELEIMYKDYYSQSNVKESKTHMLSSDVSIQSHAKYISKIAKLDWKILDFGAGTGELVSSLKNIDYDIDGVEYSSNAIVEAQQRYGLKLIPSLGGLDSDKKYDLIVAIEVIEHLTNPIEVIGSLYARLKPGGIIYFTTPNLSGIKARVKKSRWSEAEKPFHLVLFNYISLKRLLDKSGFCSVRYLRFSPLTASSPIKIIMHRILQLMGLYGGLRVLARKPESS